MAVGISALVDDREPATVVHAIQAHPEVAATEIRRLAAGDLVVGEAGFERKTIADYASAGMGRSTPDLESQVERLAEAYTHAYVLLESDLPTDDDIDGGLPAAAIRGSMASITARFGVPVLPCGNLAGLVDMAVRLGRKHAEDPSPRPLDPGAVTDRREPTVKRMYGCIDGIGPEMATRLHEAFPTVATLAAAPREDLLAIDGIGPKRVAAIEAVLRETPEEEFVPE
jgi:ERCC4-type nuclease